MTAIANAIIALLAMHHRSVIALAESQRQAVQMALEIAELRERVRRLEAES